MSKKIFYTNVNNSSEDILTPKDLLRDKLNNAEVKINEVSEKDSNGVDKVNIYTGLSIEEFNDNPELTASMLYPEKHLLGDGMGLRDKQRHAYEETDSTDESLWWERNPDPTDDSIRYTGTPFRHATHFDSAVALKDGLVIFNTAEKYINASVTSTTDPRLFPVFPSDLGNVSDKICGVIEVEISDSDSSSSVVHAEGKRFEPIHISTKDIENLTDTADAFDDIKTAITFYPVVPDETTSTITGDIHFVDDYIDFKPFIDETGAETGYLARAVVFYDPENKNMCRTDGRGIVLLKVTDSRPV